jgi:7-cyano-7-deazaguanine reductase
MLGSMGSKRPALEGRPFTPPQRAHHHARMAEKAAARGVRGERHEIAAGGSAPAPGRRTRRYTDEQAKAGIDAPLPELETWPNQYPGYEISISAPEYTSVCPKTGLPDFATLTLTYMPDRTCVELKSLKEYLLAYRNLGIFYENAVNRILEDLVSACRPVWAEVRGSFRPRGGISSTITARWPRSSSRRNGVGAA